MKINFEKVPLRYRGMITKLYNFALNYTKNDMEDAITSVSFTDEKNIKKLNNEYRKVDKVTDVLSFPMLDIVYPQKLQDFTQEFSPDGTLYIGDVVICKNVAKRQSKEYGHSTKREVAFLALHGLLHVLGYDHIKENDEKLMQSTAKEILDKLNIKRKGDV